MIRHAMSLQHLLRTQPRVARFYLLGRHGWRRMLTAVRERFSDLVLLFIAVAIALLFRGWSKHQVAAALEDVGWAALALVAYLPLVFASGSLAAWRSLRGWRVSHQEISQGVLLSLTPPRRDTEVGVYVARCVVECADRSRHEAFAQWGGGYAYVCHYNSGFPTTGVHPPHGQHVARWFMEETPGAGWVAVGSNDPFTYAPGASSSA